MKAKMHFMKVEKWFSMILRVEYFYCHQLRVNINTKRNVEACWFLIALATVKADNTSGGLLFEIIHIVCSFYQAKEISEKVRNNIIKSI